MTCCSPVKQPNPCALGYTNTGLDLNVGTQGKYVYMCFKQGNTSLPVPTSVRFSGLLYMRCNYTCVLSIARLVTHVCRFNYISFATGSPAALDSVQANMAESLGWPTQGHIALTSNDDEMMVIYVTGTTTTPSVKSGLVPTLPSS